MNKSVIMSLNAKWWKKILSGQKTMEIRKTKPNLPFPFIVYVYETKSSRGAAAVVGSFTCTGILKIDNLLEVVTEKSALLVDEIYTYAKGKPLYCWEVANVVKYDIPQPLLDFNIKRPSQSWGYVNV